MPFALTGWASGSSRPRPPRNKSMFPEFLSWASAPLQRMPEHRAAALSPRFPFGSTSGFYRTPNGGASLEVSTPTASSQPEAAAWFGWTCNSNRLRLQVLSTSWRLHPPRACRPCFMPDPLLGLPSRALLLSRSRTLSPAPLPSWRSPPPSGFCSTRESATRLSGLDYNRARSSPGSFPLQGPLSLCAGPTFAGPPLLWLAPKRKRLEGLHFRVSHAKSLACLSRDCRPSWGLWPLDS